MISRREFLKFIALAAASPKLIHASNPPDIFVGGGKQFNTKTKTTHFFLSYNDLSRNSQSFINTHFFPHGIDLHPNQDTLIAFQKKGLGACEISLREQKITRQIHAVNQRTFYGHGCFSADGSRIFSTEVKPNLEGVIGLRDARSLKVIGDFPSHGVMPHECKLIDQGKTLVVTNAGGNFQGSRQPANLAFIDVASKQLIKRYFLSRKDINAGHCLISNEGKPIVVSAPKTGENVSALGGVSIGIKHGELDSQLKPSTVINKMNGEALSVSVSTKTNTAVVSHPQGNMLTFWQLDQPQLISQVHIDRPRGVALSYNEEYFIISFGEKGQAIRIKNQGLKAPQGTLIENTYLSGSHIYNLANIHNELSSPLPL